MPCRVRKDHSLHANCLGVTHATWPRIPRNNVDVFGEIVVFQPWLRSLP